MNDLEQVIHQLATNAYEQATLHRELVLEVESLKAQLSAANIRIAVIEEARADAYERGLATR